MPMLGKMPLGKQINSFRRAVEIEERADAAMKRAIARGDQRFALKAARLRQVAFTRANAIGQTFVSPFSI
ncbi:hypothetical protein [Acidisoma cladoniae]|uniref:hypothetical protein n=1 Tax=Acidisoma cladoniae TaxID=3040935 RepID=UPI00255127DC|nr:hypothetical protein [Acidisoma sp. PAMC 29798]